jgi:signal transduction histidine kinase
MDDLPNDLLAATARAIAGPVVPAELVALFAARGASASAALLASARLDPAGWSAVRAVAAADVLPLIAAMDPAPAVPMAAPAAQPAPPLLAPAPIPEPEAKALPAGLFRWETGPTGEIDWVEGAPRAALVGRSLAESFADPFAARLPFADEALVLAEEGTLAGEWRWTGSPAFFPDTGRFAGYRGLARREGPEPAAVPAANEVQVAEDDDLRELMHELRTPLNAIIGFGEIIEGQYLGPAHRAYRERATQIVRQAHSLADAVDNLDLAARLRSGRLHGDATCDFEVVRRTIAGNRVDAEQRGVQLIVDDRVGSGSVALPPPLAERLVGQFTLAMLESAAATERFDVVIDRKANHLAIGIERPAALQGLAEQQLLADRGQAGTRFALRLVQGLATMIGGRLDIGADRLVLLLPIAV